MLEKEIEQMNDSRLINLAEHLIYPLLDKFVAEKVEEAISKFKDGETSFLSEVAYMSALKDLQISLKGKQLRGNKALNKLEENNQNGNADA